MPGTASSPIPSGPPDGRTMHYGVFYGLDPLPPDDGRPFVTVVGNCQAESLRLLLDATGAVRSVRVPPVFEIEAHELALLRRVLARTDVLVVQPVRDGYRGLPLGTAQLGAALPGGARTVVVPALRYAGLHPWQVVLRVPGEADPPPVPYHDLRTLLRATGATPPTWLAPSGVRAVRDASVAELARRESAAGAVRASDLLVPAGAGAAHTVNHPGNAVLVGLARRTAERIGLGATVPDPARTLLDEVHAPLLADVVDALGLDAAPVSTWRYRGKVLDDDEVRDVQLRWLARRPHVVRAGLDRHAATVTALGLA